MKLHGLAVNARDTLSINTTFIQKSRTFQWKDTTKNRFLFFILLKSQQKWRRFNWERYRVTEGVKYYWLFILSYLENCFIFAKVEMRERAQRAIKLHKCEYTYIKSNARNAQETDHIATWLVWYAQTYPPFLFFNSLEHTQTSMRTLNAQIRW